MRKTIKHCRKLRVENHTEKGTDRETDKHTDTQEKTKGNLGCGDILEKVVEKRKWRAGKN